MTTYLEVATALLPHATAASAWLPVVAATPAMIAAAAGVLLSTSRRLRWPAAAAVQIATNPGLVTLVFAAGMVLIGAIGWFLIPGVALFGGTILLASRELLMFALLYLAASAAVVTLLRRLESPKLNR